MKKILQVYNDILLSTYPEYGNLFSMLDLNDNKVKEWLCSSFIQLSYILIEAKGHHFPSYLDHFALCETVPFLKYYRIQLENISQFHENSLIKCFQHYLNHNCYITCRMDRYFLKHTPQYQNKHLEHLTFIYGYDLENEILYCRDNVDNGKYTDFHLDFEDVECYFHHHAVNQSWIEDGMLDLGVYKKRNQYNYNFNPDFLLKEFTFYLHSFDLKLDMNLSRYYDVQQRTSAYYNLGGYEYLKRPSLGIQAYHLFYEHKVMLKYKLDYLCSKGYVQPGPYMEKVGTLITLSNSLLLIALKQHMYNDNRHMKTVSLLLDRMKKLEVDVFERMIEELSDYIEKQRSKQM